MTKRPDIGELKKISTQVRKDILTMLTEAGSGHTGGSLSAVEILAALYFYKMRIDPKDPKKEDRDIFVLSKGHACPVLYATLAERGFFPREELMTLRKFRARLQGHAFMGVPGVEVSSGSLGQGLSIANGFALAARMAKSSRRVYCLIGDGESQEGQVWEAAMTASHYKIDNVCAILDYNKLQIEGFIKDIKGIDPVIERWGSFGWNTIEVDGHDISQLMDALDEAEKLKQKPTIIIAHTVKGKGVSFMENKAEWHGIAPKKQDLEKALKELE